MRIAVDTRYSILTPPQIQYALQIIKPIIEGHAKSFEVSKEATDKYNGWLQGRLSRSVWTDCTSYYQADGPRSKIIATFPGSVTLVSLDSLP